MNEKRLAVVKHAFQFLDTNGTGRLSLDRLCQIYNAQVHPRVRTREKKPESVFDEFQMCMGQRAQGG